VASAFTPNDGNAHLWRTSALEIKLRTIELIGIGVALSTKISRDVKLDSSCGVMYESNSIDLKSEYSYDQYHWCPIVFNVIDGLKVSSIRYNRRMEGRPIKIKMIDGVSVQNNSSSWDSRRLKFTDGNTYVSIKLILTKVIIIVTIIIAWSWKKINCSIIGDAASWNLKALGEGISKEYKLFTILKTVALYLPH